MAGRNMAPLLLWAVREFPSRMGTSPRRQEAVMRFLAGDSMAEIARKMGISSSCVHQHIDNAVWIAERLSRITVRSNGQAIERPYREAPEQIAALGVAALVGKLSDG